MAIESKHLLQDRIDNLILAQKAKDLNIKVDSEVGKQSGRPFRSESKIADPEKFHDLRQGTRRHAVMRTSRQDMKNQMLRRARDSRGSWREDAVKHEEMEKYYNEHKTDFVREERIFLQEILISTEGKDDAGVAAAEKKAKDLVARARKGERFAEMARDNSDSVTAKSYGRASGPL